MNPKKEEMLKRLDEASRIHDASLQHSIDVVTNPGTFGWRKSVLTAAVVLPLTGVSAVLNDVNKFLLSHSDDEAWDRGTPPPTPGTPDSAGGA